MFNAEAVDVLAAILQSLKLKQFAEADRLTTQALLTAQSEEEKYWEWAAEQEAAGCNASLPAFEACTPLATFATPQEASAALGAFASVEVLPNGQWLTFPPSQLIDPEECPF